MDKMVPMMSTLSLFWLTLTHRSQMEFVDEEAEAEESEEADSKDVGSAEVSCLASST